MVLSADMPVLSGNYPETCFAKYGSMPLKAKYVHEMSLRILLHAIDSCANKYSRHIVPWVSLSVDFYVRGTYVRVVAVLWCGVVWCAVLCCAVLCYAVLCCAVLCCAVLCCAVLCCAVLCCAVLCCAVLCPLLNPLLSISCPFLLLLSVSSPSSCMLF